jgi:hypothetical protein
VLEMTTSQAQVRAERLRSGPVDPSASLSSSSSDTLPSHNRNHQVQDLTTFSSSSTVLSDPKSGGGQEPGMTGGPQLPNHAFPIARNSSDTQTSSRKRAREEAEPDPCGELAVYGSLPKPSEPHDGYGNRLAYSEDPLDTASGSHNVNDEQVVNEQVVKSRQGIVSLQKVDEAALRSHSTRGPTESAEVSDNESIFSNVNFAPITFVVSYGLHKSNRMLLMMGITHYLGPGNIQIPLTYRIAGKINTISGNPRLTLQWVTNGI